MARPARSAGTPSQCAVGDAATPAAQTIVAAGIRSPPITTPSASQAVTAWFRCTSTPRSPSRFSAALESSSENAASRRLPDSTRMTRAAEQLKLRKPFRIERRATSIILPASSTPVGTSADYHEGQELQLLALSSVASARSKASSTRRRISVASSSDLRRARRAPTRHGRNRSAGHRSR